MVICERCGKKEALEHYSLCSKCWREARYGDGSLRINEFKKLYLSDPISGIFFADDAILQYQSYREDGRFTPLICGEFGGDYRESHAELYEWYHQHFFSFFEQKISAESTYNPIQENPDYYAGLKDSFIPFLKSTSSLSSSLGKYGRDGSSGSILMSYVLKKTLVLNRGVYEEEEEVEAANPSYVDIAGLAFDVGSGLYMMELFFLIRNRYVLQEFTDGLISLTPNSLSYVLDRLQLLIIPWKHQNEAISFWENGRKGIVEMATATGKTVVGLMAIEKLWKENKKAHVLVTCHRSVILNQWRREIIQKFGIIANEELSYKNPLKIGGFRIAFETVQMIMKNPHQYGTDLLIIDEVHHIAGTKYGQVLNLQHKHRLGLTAQLDDNERKRVITQKFGSIVYKYSLLEALKDGIIPEFSWIVHPVYLDVKEEAEFNELSSQIQRTFNFIKNDRKTIQLITHNKNYKVTTIGDYIYLTERAGYSGVELPDSWIALKAFLQKRRWIIHRSGPRLEKVRDFALKMADHHKIIIFLMDTESCDSLANQLKKHQKNVFVIHSKIREDPITVVNQFRKVPNGILLGVEMLNEGIDIPNADVGINVAFTKTQLQLVQRMGRILRKDGAKKPKFFQFVAVPDRSAFVEEVDAPEFIDDLAWVQSTAIKMGLDLEIALDTQELLKFKSDAESFIRNSYQTVTSNQQTFGTFNLKKALEEFDGFAVKRIIEILKLFADNQISDKQWEDVIRTAYTTVDKEGRFEKARFVDVAKSWYILIIANRDGKKISKFFSDVTIIEDSGSVPLPLLQLNNSGEIVFCRNVSGSTGSDVIETINVPDPSIKPEKHLISGIPQLDSDNKVIVDVASPKIDKIPSSGDIYSRIIGDEREDKITYFETSDEIPAAQNKIPDHTSSSFGIDFIKSLISQGMYAEIRHLLEDSLTGVNSPEFSLCHSLECLKNGNLDASIMWMEKTLKEYPDSVLTEHYRRMCEIAGKKPLNIISRFGRGKRVVIPSLEDSPLSASDALKWIGAYESGAIDDAIGVYRKLVTDKSQGPSTKKSETESELECIEVMRSNIYLLKLFVTK